jgi:hypothetical protein
VIRPEAKLGVLRGPKEKSTAHNIERPGSFGAGRRTWPKLKGHGERLRDPRGRLHIDSGPSRGRSIDGWVPPALAAWRRSASTLRNASMLARLEIVRVDGSASGRLARMGFDEGPAPPIVRLKEFARSAVRATVTTKPIPVDRCRSRRSDGSRSAPAVRAHFRYDDLCRLADLLMRLDAPPPANEPIGVLRK